MPRRSKKFSVGPGPVIRRTALRFLLVLYLALFASGAVVSVLPREPLEPLVAPDGWPLHQGFELTPWRGTAYDRRFEVAGDPRVVYWMAAPVADGGFEHRLESEPFATPAAIMVPYRIINQQQHLGDPRIETHVDMHLECLASASELQLARFVTHRHAEVLVDVPGDFCPGESRLVVATRFPYHVTVGTPHRATSAHLFAQSAPVHVYRHGVLFAVLATVGTAGALAFRRLRERTNAPVALLVTLGLSGYAAFFAYFFSATLGRLFSGAVLLCSLSIAGVALRRHREVLRLTLAALRHSLGLWFLASLFFVLLLFALDTEAGPWQANNRYWPAWWSSDNNLPMEVSETIYRGDEIVGLFGANWNVSDRPPLQAGLATLARPFARVVLTGGGAGPFLADYHHTLGVVVNSLWVMAVAELLRVVGLRRRATTATVIVLAATPLAIFNTTYVWPKMLGAAYGIAALALMLPSALHLPSFRAVAYRSLPVAAGLGAFSLLSHGAGVFFFLGAIVWGVRRIGLPPLRPLLAALAVIAVLLTPWLAWQRIVDPPGNALVKSAFAGTFGFDEKDKGVLETVSEAYRQISVSEWVDQKRDGLELLTVGGWDFPDAGWNWFERRRLTDFFFVIPSSTILAVAVLGVVLVRRPRGRGIRGIYAASRALVAIGALGVGADWLLTWGPQIVHHQAYASLLLLLLGGLVGSVAFLGRLSYLIVAPAFAYGVATWVVEPLLGSAGVDPLAVALCMGMVGFAVVQLRWLRV